MICPAMRPPRFRKGIQSKARSSRLMRSRRRRPFYWSMVLGTGPRSKVGREGSRGLARISEAFLECWQSGLGGVVNLLMFQPVGYIEVGIAINHVSADTPVLFKLEQPAVNQLGRVVIVGVEKAREHSRGGASPSGIIRQRPNLDEQQPGISRQFADRLRLRKLGLDRSNSRHGRPS
jgi:hypothetical protein